MPRILHGSTLYRGVHGTVAGLLRGQEYCKGVLYIGEYMKQWQISPGAKNIAWEYRGVHGNRGRTPQGPRILQGSTLYMGVHGTVAGTPDPRILQGSTLYRGVHGNSRKGPRILRRSAFYMEY